MAAHDGGIKVRAMFKKDQERRGLMPSSVARIGSSIRAWSRWLGDVHPFDATEQHVQAFLDEKRICSRTRYAWLAHLHSFYEWAIREELTGHDPTVRIIRPRLRAGLPRPVRDDDLVLALEHATPMMLVWLTLMGFGGLRCAEVAGLTRGSIVDSQGLLRVLGKGHKERMVPIHEEVWAALRSWGALPRAGALFRRQGRPYRPHEVSEEVNEYLHGLGITATAHQFRHWCLTGVCRDHGLRVTQQLAGHSSPATTAGYTLVSGSEVLGAVAGLTRPSPAPLV